MAISFSLATTSLPFWSKPGPANTNHEKSLKRSEGLLMGNDASVPGDRIPLTDESTLTAAPGLLESQLTAKPGDRFGHYKILEEIGQGGCGAVFVAEQEQPVRRRVALKVIKLGMDTRQV